MDALCRELEACKKVLEVGVGTGRFAIPLQSRGIPLLGVDISSRMLAEGRSKGLGNVALADALFLPFEESAFDATYSVHVLHLIGDWRDALKEIARVTRSSYYTVASYVENDDTPHTIYHQFLQDAGFGKQRPGVFERDLPEFILPKRRVHVGTFVERRRTSEIIQNLEERSFSSQWTLPEEVHRKALQAAASDIKGKTLTMRKRVELIHWDVDDLTQS